MKKNQTFLAGVFLISSVFAQEVSFSGNINTEWGVAAPGTENQGDFTIGKTGFTGSVEVYSGNGTAFAEGTVEYDSLQNNLAYNAGEMYIDYSAAFWGLRIGRQKVVWGKADGVNITNEVFPEDSTSLFNEDSALPVNGVRLSLTGSAFTADAYWLPFTTVSALPLENGNPLKKILVPDTVSFDVPVMGTLTIPVSVGKLSTPETSLKNGEYGLKLSGYLPFCDLSLYGFYGWDKTPMLNYSIVYNNGFLPSNIEVTGEYKRMSMIGLDAAFPIGATVLRLEGGFFPNRHFQANQETVIQKREVSIKQNQLKALAGLDWMPSGWTITAQYYCDYVLNKSENLERKNSYQHGATLSVSKTLLEETLELSLAGLIGLNDFDSAINFTAKYSLSDQINLKLGTYVFLEGPSDKGTYGKFKDLSTIYIRAEYRF